MEVEEVAMEVEEVAMEVEEVAMEVVAGDTGEVAGDTGEVAVAVAKVVAVVGDTVDVAKVVAIDGMETGVIILALDSIIAMAITTIQMEMVMITMMTMGTFGSTILPWFPIQSMMYMVT